MTAAGDVVPVTTIDDLHGRLIARGERTTSSSTTTTETGVLRVDNVATVVGRIYWIATNNLWLASSVSLDVIAGRVRYNTGGTATTSSTILGEGGAHEPALASYGVPVLLKYVPGSTANVSFLLSVARVGGTGNVSIAVATNHPTIDLFVFDGGTDPGDTGTDL